MSNTFTIFDKSGAAVRSSHGGPRVVRYTPGGGNAPQPTHLGGGYGSPREREYEDAFRKLKEDPKLVATVVEMREDRMLVSVGSGQLLDIHAIKDCQVGGRVTLNRNTMQALEALPSTEVPTGHVLTVDRCDQHVVEGQLLGTLKAFRAPPWEVRKGERVIVDSSMAFVIGTLGMPSSSFQSTPKVSVSWTDIGGQDEAKNALREAIELPLAHPKLFAAYGKRPSRGVLLSGPPGTGKTLLAKAAATAIARAFGEHATSGFIYVKGPELLSKWIGESESQVRGLFAAARKHKEAAGYPAVVFLDECDALLGARDRGAHMGITTTVVPQFLAEMDGLDDSAAMFILATNRPDMLDPAVVREGRIDRKVRVSRPAKADVQAIFQIHLKGRPLSGEGHAQIATEAFFADDRVVRDLGNGMVIRLRDFAAGAKLVGIVEDASTRAILRDVEAGRKKPSGIHPDDLLAVIDRSMSGLADTDLRDIAREIAEARA